jgi:hypothetical protein
MSINVSPSSGIAVHLGEDTLWAKYNEIRKVLSPVKRQAAAVPRPPQRMDDSGRKVDMEEVCQNLFVGSV